ncbi:unnamed protein product [Sphenostylis stenocarpa]|uniref:Leucine-rich repeat-containing N-terminal plant-type domain-containing protein n=1 Tax=Sphenostylis stenocarpa TaxID=92480 RepID=A0AA86TCK9_9FABA|nr:unnamed protein product [Sphenostylis stenocarpa]
MATATCTSKRLLLSVSLTLTLLHLGASNSEGDSLYTLKRSLSDPDNVLQSWDPTLVSPCTWFHVTCNQDNRVTRVYFLSPLSLLFVSVMLDLGNSNLSGHLVPELGRLEHLHELYKNNIQGTIPPELGNLKSLVSLDLYNNNISGTIPSSLGKLKNLVFLRLNDNRLTGPIPKELAAVSSLKVVDVSNNDLCGTIPTSGPFEHIPLNNFENNPRLEGPELLGLLGGWIPISKKTWLCIFFKLTFSALIVGIRRLRIGIIWRAEIILFDKDILASDDTFRLLALCKAKKRLMKAINGAKAVSAAQFDANHN